MPNSLTDDVAEIMNIVGYVQYNARNRFHGYSYATANAVFSKVREELSSRKIAIHRDVDKSTVLCCDVYDDGKDKKKYNVIYNWVGMLRRGNQTIPMCGMGQGADNTDKAVMKAQTAALKYALAGTFLISWGDDPEAEAKDEPAEPAPAKKSAPAPKKPRGAEKKDPINIGPIVEKMRTATSLEELEKYVAATKRLTIREQDRPALNEVYLTKKAELEAA